MRDHVVSHTIPAALSLLPSKMDTPEARAMLVCIGMQESRFRHRKQVSGPARGFWQFEPIGVEGVLDHRASAQHAIEVCGELLYEPQQAVVYQAIRDNDALACCFARLLLWTHPEALPGPADAQLGWETYTDTWRPGRPHRGTWDAFYAEAWNLIGD